MKIPFHAIASEPEIVQYGLLGSVKELMFVSYKARTIAGTVVKGKIDFSYSHNYENCILHFDETGGTRKKIVFALNSHSEYGFDKDAKLINTISCYNNKVWNKCFHIYDANGNLIETNIYDNNDILQTKMTYIFDENNKCTEEIVYHNGDKIFSRASSTYDKEGRQTSKYEYDAAGTIKLRFLNTYNENGLLIESLFEIAGGTSAYNRITRNKYNQYGDNIELSFYQLTGELIEQHHYSYEYDSEGKRIINQNPQKYDPTALAEGETEEHEYDKHGNWIEKRCFYQGLPASIMERQIIYYGEDATEKELIHPASLITYHMESTIKKEQLSIEELKWIAESKEHNIEDLPTLRYYIAQFKEMPSTIVDNGPFIEAFTLLKDLTEDYSVQEIHSHAKIWDGHKTIESYSIVFPDYPGYLLSATGITRHDSEDFEVPNNIDYSDYDLFFSEIEFLCPSTSSELKDKDFEDEIDDYISRCRLKKKPNKPVINIIETNSGGFVMNSHAVNDNFVIKDLDLNYGEGFEKFHEELMYRFNTGKKGLVLLHGQPGTGKTYYIRHLLRTMVANKKVVIYLPPNMVDHLVDPIFMTFLSAKVKQWSLGGNFCVLLIEDAEPLLAKRQEGVRIQGVTNLLNMSDGLLNDMLNLQIICTFNVDLKKLDSALLRPGRLIARKEFKALPELDANLLAQRLGIKHHFKGPATLGEIYTKSKHATPLVHDVDHNHNSSTDLDDM